MTRSAVLDEGLSDDPEARSASIVSAPSESRSGRTRSVRRDAHEPARDIGRRGVDEVRDTGPVVETEDPGDGRVARVVVDQDDLTTAPCRDRGEVRGDLAAGAVGSGSDDDDRARGTPALEECGLGQDEPIRGGRGGIRCLVEQTAIARRQGATDVDVAEMRQAGQPGELVL